MRLSTLPAVLGLAAALLAGAAPAAFAADSPQAKSCRQRANTEGKGVADYYAKCMDGALAPDRPTGKPASLGEQAITAPSGADRTVRSDSCSAEADRRGLKSGERDNFRRACLASAAPAKAVGIAGQPTKPTPEKTEFGGLTATPKGGQGAATSAGAQIKPK